MASNKWSAQHYNALAKEIRELFPTLNNDIALAKRATLTTLALNLATRFVDDNERFDPLMFLDACSPNTDLFPLSELWENYE